MSNVRAFPGRAKRSRSHGGGDGGAEHDMWLRRQACNVLAQLPDSSEDATKVLDYARKLIEVFWIDTPGTFE